MKKLINKGIVFLSASSIVISLIALKEARKPGPPGRQGKPGPKGDRALTEKEELDKLIEDTKKAKEKIYEGGELYKLLDKRQKLAEAERVRSQWPVDDKMIKVILEENDKKLNSFN